MERMMMTSRVFTSGVPPNLTKFATTSIFNYTVSIYFNQPTPALAGPPFHGVFREKWVDRKSVLEAFFIGTEAAAKFNAEQGKHGNAYQLWDVVRWVPMHITK